MNRAVRLYWRIIRGEDDVVESLFVHGGKIFSRSIAREGLLFDEGVCVGGMESVEESSGSKEGDCWGRRALVSKTDGAPGV